MYEKQFQFRSRPFCSIPSAEQYFPASAIDNTLETVKICIDRASGPAVIFGQPGWGKSLLLSVLQRDYKSQFRVVNTLACTRMSRRHDLLQNILFELGQPYRDMSEGELRLALIDYLKPSAQCPNGMLLQVDDGHSMPARLLDELRMITNFVRDGQSRVRLVIAGTQQLEEKLTHPQLESLNQRIAARCYLQCLRRDEIEAYIRHHVLRAGRSEQNIFQNSAIAAVAQLCDGNPRTINQVCDHALILAASCGHLTVSGEIIAEAFSDIQRLPASMWIPSLDDKPKAVDGTTNGSWSVLEFGQINDAPTNRSDEVVDHDDDWNTHQENLEVATPDTISDSMDEFSRMVDSLAQLYAESMDDEQATIDGSPSMTPLSTDSEELSAVDPFAEPFAEEFTVPDTYAQLAASQNRASTKITDHDLARIGDQLQDLQGDVNKILAPTPVSSDASNTASFTPTAFSAHEFAKTTGSRGADTFVAQPTPAIGDSLPPTHEPTSLNVVEYPLTQHESYCTHNDTPRSAQDLSTLQPNIDDRDMLIVANSVTTTKPSPRVAPLDLGGTTVSRGQAIRLEYGKLFKRLRGEESK